MRAQTQIDEKWPTGKQQSDAPPFSNTHLEKIENLDLFVLETVGNLALEKTNKLRAEVQLRRAKDDFAGITTAAVDVVRLL